MTDKTRTAPENWVFIDSRNVMWCETGYRLLEMESSLGETMEFGEVMLNYGWSMSDDGEGGRYLKVLIRTLDESVHYGF